MRVQPAASVLVWRQALSMWLAWCAVSMCAPLPAQHLGRQRTNTAMLLHTPVSDGAGDEGGCDDGECELEHPEHAHWDGGSQVLQGGSTHSVHEATQLCGVADDAVAAGWGLAKGQAKPVCVGVHTARHRAKGGEVQKGGESNRAPREARLLGP
jgi:hypothetical protein